MHAITYAKNWNTQVKDAGVHPRPPLFIDTCRASGQDDPFRGKGLDPVKADPWRFYLTIDAVLTHPSGNELVVLRAKVYDQNHVFAFPILNLLPLFHQVNEFVKYRFPHKYGDRGVKISMVFIYGMIPARKKRSWSVPAKSLPHWHKAKQEGT